MCPVSLGLGSRRPGLVLRLVRPPVGLGEDWGPLQVTGTSQPKPIVGGPHLFPELFVVLSAKCHLTLGLGWWAPCLSVHLGWLSAPPPQTWPARAEGDPAPVPRPEMQPPPADLPGQRDDPGRPRGLRDSVVGRAEHRGPHRLHPVHLVHQVGPGSGFRGGIMIGGAQSQRGENVGAGTPGWRQHVWPLHCAGGETESLGGHSVTGSQGGTEPHLLAPGPFLHTGLPRASSVGCRQLWGQGKWLRLSLTCCGLGVSGFPFPTSVSSSVKG